MRYIYVLKCCDGTLYTGITTDLERRVEEHNTSPKWAKYTKARRPVMLVRSEEVTSRSEASKIECKIKKLSREEKEWLVQGNNLEMR
jgi:putative endonuclease